MIAEVVRRKVDRGELGLTVARRKRDQEALDLAALHGFELLGQQMMNGRCLIPWLYPLREPDQTHAIAVGRADFGVGEEVKTAG